MKKLRYLATLALVAVAASHVLAADWMTRLSPDTRVCSLSIPGAHDAATGNGFEGVDSVVGERYARTQELDLSQQFAAGVRAFDLRPAQCGNELRIFHGTLATRLSYAHALRLLADSLKANPASLVVVVQRHEDDAKGAGYDQSRWAQLVDSTLHELGPVLIDYRPGLTVGEMRGHILVLSRDRYGQVPRGGYIDNWDDGGSWSAPQGARVTGVQGGERLYVQDYYNTTMEGAMTTKLDLMRQFLVHAAITPLRGSMWVVNHCSAFARDPEAPLPGNTTSNGYRLNAASTNAYMARCVVAHAGLVMMDYAGVDASNGIKVMGKTALQAVIESNFTASNDKKR